MNQACAPTLQLYERLYHRDQLRSARYAALADSEGFPAICYALEALGLRLRGEKGDLRKYEPCLAKLACDSTVLTDLSESKSQYFTKFSSLYDFIRNARNDAMHSGVYARHVTSAAIELCIGLEEALMMGQQIIPRKLVKDFMVKAPVTIEQWQPVAHARQLMLMHSFSFLPVFIDGWKLLSEMAMARYLRSGGVWKEMLAASIEVASNSGLSLVPAEVVSLDREVKELLFTTATSSSPTLWLVEENSGNKPEKLCGVLSPFELM